MAGSGLRGVRGGMMKTRVRRSWVLMVDGGPGDVDVVQERGALALVGALDQQPGVADAFGCNLPASRAGLLVVAGVGARCEPRQVRRRARWVLGVEEKRCGVDGVCAGECVPGAGATEQRIWGGIAAAG